MTRRVVVTGMSGISPLGSNWGVVADNLINKKSAVTLMEDWHEIEGLRTQVGAIVKDFDIPAHYTRKKTRSMGRVALMATRASEIAIADANLNENDALTNGVTGISYGSTSGSPPATAEYAEMLIKKKIGGITATNYIKMMSHTCAANLGQFFQIKGRIIPTCSACTSGSQGIGYGYESVKYGMHDIMLTGGAEEHSASQAAVFDIMYATSEKNATPEQTPSPFDVDRDGLVIGEGAATLILEELEHAQQRGANIYAEVVGFGTNSDGKHVTNPSVDGMAQAMSLALNDAKLSPVDIGYINAHGTATELGDIAETNATERVFGNNIAISSLKSYMGHTMGACGAIEAWMTIQMMNHDWFAPTINLKSVDPRCGNLNYLMDVTQINSEYVMSNNFAFGGINTSLIFKRW